MWSIGAVVGGAMAAGAIALGVSRGVHLAVAGVVFAVVALTALRSATAPGVPPGSRERPPSAALPW